MKLSRTIHLSKHATSASERAPNSDGNQVKIRTQSDRTSSSARSDYKLAEIRLRFDWTSSLIRPQSDSNRIATIIQSIDAVKMRTPWRRRYYAHTPHLYTITSPSSDLQNCILIKNAQYFHPRIIAMMDTIINALNPSGRRRLHSRQITAKIQSNHDHWLLRSSQIMIEIQSDHDRDIASTYHNLTEF